MKCIGEFYGATEGNSNVLNIESKPGSVGFTSVLLPFVYPVSLIRIDEEGSPIRDENGLCMRCEPGEPGEFVGKIVKGERNLLPGCIFYFSRLFLYSNNPFTIVFFVSSINRFSGSDALPGKMLDLKLLKISWGGVIGVVLFLAPVGAYPYPSPNPAGLS